MVYQESNDLKDTCTMITVFDYRKIGTLFLTVLMLQSTSGARAEVIFDGSFGHTDIRAGNFLISESDGQLSDNGVNLFHSFDTFNVNLGETATFTSDSASVQTIIGRVTGVSESIIDGTIVSDANVWIANPNGVLIGATAIFDGSGLIRVEQADTVNFADGTSFRARSLDVSSLSIASPASFGFLSARLDGALGGISKDVLTDATSAAILTAADGVQDGFNLFYSFDLFSIYPSQFLEFDVFNIDNLIVFSNGLENSMLNSNIQVNDPLTSFWFFNPNGVVVGDKVSFDFSGALNIGSATTLLLEDDSLWSLDTTTDLVPIDFGVSGLEGAAIFDGAMISAGSSVRIVGGQLVAINESIIDSSSIDTTDGGRIVIVADEVQLTDSNLSSYAFSDGRAGDINITGAIEVSLDSSSLVSESTGEGEAGSISLSSPVLISINDSRVSSNATGNGNAGLINFAGGDVEINGSDITSDAFATDPTSTNASAGVIGITGQNITIADGEIFTDSETDNPDVEFLGLITINAVDTLTISEASKIGTQTLAAAGAGQIALSADVLSVSDSTISSTTSSSGSAGFVSLTATNGLNLSEGSVVATNTSGTGNAGQITLSAVELTAQDSTIGSSSAGSGSAGSVSLEGTDSLNLLGGIVTSSSTGSGDAGFITLRGGKVELASVSITSDAFPDDFSDGDIGASAGFIQVDGDDITITNSELFADSSTDNAVTNFPGVILLTAIETVSIESTKIGTNTFGAGQAGIVSITGSVIDITGASQIESNTFAEGNAGDLLLTGGIVSLSDSNVSAISHDGASGAAGGIFVKGGTITVNVGGTLDTTTSSIDGSNSAANISLEATQRISLNGAVISADTFGAASAGNVLLSAPDILLANNTSILSGTVGAATGDAGGISLVAETAAISASQLLSDVAGSSGNGGKIEINAMQSLTLNDGAQILSDTDAQGNAGSIFVSTDTLRIDNSAITSKSVGEFDGAGNSGIIDLDIGTVLAAQNGLISTSSLYSQGGDILITTRNSEILLADSTIGASAGANGNGGNIFLETDFLLLERSNVLAKAEAGNGGFINIDGKLLDGSVTPALRSELLVVQDFNSRISADSDTGTAGTVNIAAPNNDISAIVSSQNADTLDAPQLASNRCDQSTNQSRLTSKPSGYVRGVPDSHLSVTDGNTMTDNADGLALYSIACRDVVVDAGGDNE